MSKFDFKPQTFKKFTDLPFINREGEWSNWDTPKTQSYEEACNLGRYYAACFLDYQQNDPSFVGSNVLGMIMQDIDFKDESSNKGIYVGFLAFLEIFTYHGAKNARMWDFFEERHSRMAKITSARKKEVAEVSVILQTQK